MKLIKTKHVKYSSPKFPLPLNPFSGAYQLWERYSLTEFTYELN
ncbi:hypothetical protein AVV30_gp091 [Vibrio phage phi 1]|uniref:Uncharacterized protein n=1 Tax=Vibrio phage phi 1 TaxID=1589297 RepID=A0A0B5HAJ1_9CAUD|nr:hypothetical protein AVV30_gp091 [Vibrio phage phi 1]AJF40749.1 hypothetical protein SBVP1_0091 [Vibrio phage phi 1]